MPAVAGAPDRRRAIAIVHDIRGRLRLRLPAASRAAGLEAALAAVPGVIACAWSPRTRSLLVRYDAADTSPEAILEAVVAHAGVEPPATPQPIPLRSPRPAGARPLAAAVRDTVSEVNAALRRTTGDTLDLGQLVPLGLAAWAVLEIVRGRVGPLAWSAALWYAHGLFRDYNLPASD